jgi:hypothetical protein
VGIEIVSSGYWLILVQPSNVSQAMVYFFPGTKWCGYGNTATNYYHLGEFFNEDKCCRSHDHCDSIESGETKYGLTNTEKYAM